MSLRDGIKNYAVIYRTFLRNATARQLLNLGRVMLKKRSAKITVGTIAVTYRCQNSCIHCGVQGYRVRKSEELTTEQMKQVINQIRALDVPVLVFFGGEPLVRTDLPELVEHASRQGLMVKIDTNGVALDRAMAQRLKDAGVNNVSVSLDAACPEIHDELRRNAGAFHKAVQAVRHCLALGIPVSISTYASRRGLESGELERLIEFGRELRVTNVRVLLPYLAGRWLRSEQELLTDEEKERVRRIVDRSFAYLGTMSTNCLCADRQLIFISPYGDVQPCGLVPFGFGNVREKPLPAILEDLYAHPFLEGIDPRECVANNPEIRRRYLDRIPEDEQPPWPIDRLMG